MKSLIVYDSFFGNTEKVAHALGQALGSETVKVQNMVPDQLLGVELLILGSPTRAFSPSPDMSKFLKSQPSQAFKGMMVSAFDTRLAMADVNSKFLSFMVKIFGYAAETMVNPQGKFGADLISRIEAALSGHQTEMTRLIRSATGQPVTRERLRTLFSEELPARLGNDDRLLVYFAGHGVALDGDDGPAGYLVPQDAVPGSSASMLPMTDLHAWLTALPCRHMLAILDCCFAGAFRWASTRNLGALPEVLHKERYDRYLLSPAWQVLTSAAASAAKTGSWILMANCLASSNIFSSENTASLWQIRTASATRSQAL